MPKIGVFPASGGLGSSIVKHLQTLVPASDLILIARNPSKLSDEKEAGATIRQADYDDASSLDEAFDGVDILMLISYASFEIDHRVNAHRLAIDKAIKSGVKHIFYSSLAFAGLTNKSLAHVMGAHLATEEYLSTKPEISYTVVREGLYTESFPIYTAWFDPQNPVDEITIPHSGGGPGVAWVKRDELGEATAKLIASYVQDPTAFGYVNKMVLLSGQRVISMAETVEILGRAIGKDVRIRDISVDEYAKLPHDGKHTYHGVDLSKEWATAWEAIKAGETAVVSPAIVEILGREPERYEDSIKDLIRS
ncbi:uncharacterized protein N7484_007984 [Penicillium longicatenatum]|uniref:uncharacterized protein n=1 Tax=Penicillium longicatenatum TaxID=1561947 RepID=UPI002548F511|nr:uncharacterized protein N7484_007984 [Penicillium longicatenatum]KAJ5640122.1 hypothetical protein N7484_007984 [Penicillium longicatenatum]